MSTQTTERPLIDWEANLHFKTEKRAEVLLRDFGSYLSPATHEASKLLALHQRGNLTDEDIYELHTGLPLEQREQVTGIALDFSVVSNYLRDNIPTRPPEHEKWTTPAHLNDIEGLIDLADSVNLETILIYSAHLLATLDVHDGQSEAAYDAIVQAESIFAPLCEIIGERGDGLAMALNSKVKRIRMRNSGHSHFVDESERIALMYQDKDGDYAAIFHHFATNILSKLVGEPNLQPNHSSDAKHGTVAEEGRYNSDVNNIFARLKTIGARAEKLLRSFIEKGIMEVNLDDIGMTVVSPDDEHLIESYISAIKNMLATDEITPWPSPTRDHAFFVQGSQEFKDLIRPILTKEFGEELVQFDDKDTGFHVAKMTGYYEDDQGCVPFEVQFLTQEIRNGARTGPFAHIFYKLQRKLGIKYIPTDQEIKGLTNVNKRQKHLGSDGLCPKSRARLNELLQNYMEKTQ